MIIEVFFVYLLANARPPEEPQRTQEDEQIDNFCAPYLNQGVDHYANCVAERGRIAEQERQRQENSRRMIELNGGVASRPSPSNCNSQAALNACQKESVETINTLKNPYTPDGEVKRLLQSCRAACNPDSAQVLRHFLGGCTNDISSVKHTMLNTMNSCGTSTAATNVVSAAVPQDVRNLMSSDMSISDKLNAGAQRLLGYSWNPAAGTSTNAIISTEGTQLSGGVRYMQITVGGVQTFGYCSVDNSCHQTYEEAAQASAPLLVRNGVYGKNVNPTITAAVANPFAGPTDTYKEAFHTENPLDNADSIISEETPTNLSFGDIQDTNPIDSEYSLGTGAEPPAVAKEIVALTDSPHAKTNDGSPPTVTPSRNDFPGLYKGGNYPNLHNGINSNPEISASSVSIGNGEVVSGGYGAQGNDVRNLSGEIKPIGFTGSGQVTPTQFQAANGPNGSPQAPSQRGSAISFGAGVPQTSGALPAGGGISGTPRVASLRPGNQQIGAPAIQMRSDVFYNTGTRGFAQGPQGRNLNKCQGPNCRRVLRGKKAATLNCDGNPQCILALTGKLRGSGQQRMRGEWHSNFSHHAFANSGRSVASVRSRTVPGGIVRGKNIDILNMMIQSDVFKLDHEGLLQLDP